MTTQLAFSRCSFTELHSAPNDGKDSNHPNRLQLLRKEGKALSSQKLLEVSQFSLLTLVRGRKTSHTFFLFKHEPHISQRRNLSSSSFLEAGSEVLLQVEQNKKEIRAKHVLSEHCKPHSTAGVAGGSVHLFCHTLESRTGNEISCLMVQLLQAQGLMSRYHKQRGKRRESE